MNSSLVGDPLIAQMYKEDPDRGRASSAPSSAATSWHSSRARRPRLSRHMVRASCHQAAGSPIRHSPIRAAAVLTASRWRSGTLKATLLRCSTVCARPGRRFPRTWWCRSMRAAEVLWRIAYLRRCIRGEWPRERFAAHGIAYDVSKRNKSDIAEFLPALNGRRVVTRSSPADRAVLQFGTQDNARRAGQHRPPAAQFG